MLHRRDSEQSRTLTLRWGIEMDDEEHGLFPLDVSARGFLQSLLCAANTEQVTIVGNATAAT